MKKNIFAIAVLISSLMSLYNSFNVHNTIMDSFKNSHPKEIFKVWHTVYKKGSEYNINTELGINKYKTFKANLQIIEKINKENRGYTLGINHLTDKTFDEVKQYYNLIDFNINDQRNKLRALASANLDDYEEGANIKPKNLKYNWSAINHTSFCRPIRDQGQCGSCWAFATVGLLEALWQLKNNKQLSDDLAPQQLVDCDTTSNGCNGGWIQGPIQYLLKDKYMDFETEYPYTAKDGTCYQDNVTNHSDILTKGLKMSWSAESVHSILLDGAVGTSVQVTSEFCMYRTGVLNTQCTGWPNHAVVIVGYGLENNVEYWLVRNSWGASWGDKGYIKIQRNDANKSSCHLTECGVQPQI